MAAAEKLAAARASVPSSSEEGTTSDSSSTSRGSSGYTKSAEDTQDMASVCIILEGCMSAAQAEEVRDKQHIHSRPETGSAHEGRSVCAPNALVSAGCRQRKLLDICHS